MATLTLRTGTYSTSPQLSGHRAQTEEAIARVRFDASLDDRERARLITEIVAEANRGVLARASR